MAKITNYYTSLMSLYDSVMKVGLVLPFVKVDREKYLRKKLRKYLSDDRIQQVLESGPLSVLESSVLNKMARREIMLYAVVVGFISFLVALPQSGILMWLGIIVDFIQFQLFIFIAMQKILYLFGCQDLLKKDENFSETANWMMLIISTVMIGKHQLARMAKSAIGMAMRQSVQRFAVRMVTKLMFLNIVRQMTKWMGVVVTREMIEHSMVYVVPAICAFISGLISLWLFLPMMHRLRSYLLELAMKGKRPIEGMLEEAKIMEE